MKESITAIILAGGESRRMERHDKALITVNGMPLIEHVINRLQPQVNSIIISVNNNVDQYSIYGFPVIQDEVQNNLGPLSGIYSCLHKIETDYMLTVPCDCPLLPNDLVSRLFSAITHENADIAVVYINQKIQPVLNLIKRKTELLDSLSKYLAQGHRRADFWIKQQHISAVDFSDREKNFLNINNLNDIQMLEEILKTEK